MDDRPYLLMSGVCMSCLPDFRWVSEADDPSGRAWQIDSLSLWYALTGNLSHYAVITYFAAQQYQLYQI